MAEVLSLKIGDTVSWTGIENRAPGGMGKVLGFFGRGVIVGLTPEDQKLYDGYIAIVVFEPFLTKENL